MREKTLSLLSTLEKGENAKAHGFPALFGEDGQIRPWLIQAIECFVSSLCQISPEGRSPFVSSAAAITTKTDGSLVSPEIGKEKCQQESFEVCKETQRKEVEQNHSDVSISIEDEARRGELVNLIRQATSKGRCSLEDSQACKVTQRSERKEDEIAFFRSVLFKDDGQIRPWISNALERLFSSFCKHPLEGRCSFGNATSRVVSPVPEMEVECLASKSHGGGAQAKRATPNQERTPKSSEASALMEEEGRKEEFFKLLRHASSKGDGMFKNDDFLEKCKMILFLDSSKDDLPVWKSFSKGASTMEVENGEEREEEISAEMVIGSSLAKGLEREKKETNGPQVNSPPDNRQNAVNEALTLPMQKGGRFLEKENHSITPNGHAKDKIENVGPVVINPPDNGIGAVHGDTHLLLSKVDGLPELGGTNGAFKGTFADMVRLGNLPSLPSNPSHVISNISSPHILSRGNGQEHMPSAPHGSSLSSLKNDEADPFSNKEHAVHAQPSSPNIAKESSAQVPCLTDSSKEKPPTLKVDSEILNKRMSLCKFSVIAKISLAKGEVPWTVQKLRLKLEEIWKLNSSWRLIGLGKGYFQVLLLSQEEWDIVWAKGSILLKPGIMRLQRWSIFFDPLKEKTTNAQVWFRIFQLPWGLWDPNVILGIARKVGTPLKIDDATLNGDFGYYARVLVDVDLSKAPPSAIHIECGNHSMVVNINPENLPLFCCNCQNIGHNSSECRFLISKADLSWHIKGKRGGEPGLLTAGNVCSKASQSGFATFKGKNPGNPNKKARNEVECFDEALGSHFLASSMAPPMSNRFLNASITKEVFNVMGIEKQRQHASDTKTDHAPNRMKEPTQQVHHAPDNQASRVEMLTCTSNKVSQGFCKGESNKGKSVHTTQVESPNKFSALSAIVEEDVFKSSMPSFPNGEQRDTMSCSGDEFITPNIPEKWSDIFDEDNETERQLSWEEANALIIKAQSDFGNTYGSMTEFRARLHEDCLWFNKDDSQYDRDMYAEREHFKNSAKETRTFIANLPKKDKKVKVGFRQSQGRAYSPKS